MPIQAQENSSSPIQEQQENSTSPDGKETPAQVANQVEQNTSTTTFFILGGLFVGICLIIFLVMREDSHTC